jgi:hypothetical protein
LCGCFLFSLFVARVFARFVLSGGNIDGGNMLSRSITSAGRGRLTTGTIGLFMGLLAGVPA